jgi:hypothetical protein
MGESAFFEAEDSSTLLGRIEVGEVSKSKIAIQSGRFGVEVVGELKSEPELSPSAGSVRQRPKRP